MKIVEMYQSCTAIFEFKVSKWFGNKITTTFKLSSENICLKWHACIKGVTHVVLIRIWVENADFY